MNEDGTYVVGKDVQPGTYRTRGPVPGVVADCHWSRLKDLSGTSSAVIDIGNENGQGFVTIQADDVAFKTSGCEPWQKMP